MSTGNCYRYFFSYLMCVFSSVTLAAHNPVVNMDLPDVSVVQAGNKYYMSSTTMHLSPGLPILKSDDLVNWEIVSYAYDRLVENEEINLQNGKNAYGKGSWASSLRYHNNRFYVSTFSATSGKTHIYSTTDVETGDWQSHSFEPALHDNSLFFDDDGRVYMIYGGGQIKLIELDEDATSIKPEGLNKILIDNANLVFGEHDAGGLPAEGSQMFKINGKYYLFTIASPESHWSRTVIVHRADEITGPYESRIMMQDRQVAQGGLIQAPDGAWYAMLFGDRGPVGRIPFLVPVSWQNNWPVLGVEGKVPDILPHLPARAGYKGLVSSDDFERKEGDRLLPLVWQWNHNPDDKNWTLLSDPGRLRISTSRIDENVLHARNTLTQRTFGPTSSANTQIDVSNMKDGDVAGLIALQKEYGFIGVRAEGDNKIIIVEQAAPGSDKPVPPKSSVGSQASVPRGQEAVFLRIDCDFRTNVASFYYKFDDEDWIPLGSKLHMRYTIPEHFMGYRFGLFNYATKTPGGSVDFNYYQVGKRSEIY